jgi:Protein of unknown function (DUF938)
MQYFALNMLKLLEERRQQPDRGSEPGSKLGLRWYPTDASRSSLASQMAYRNEHADLLSAAICEPLPLTLNERGIVELDTAQQLDSVASSGGGGFHVMLCVNMVHIAPWSATLGLFQAASRYLHRDANNSGAALVLYGPFRVNGTMVESNV